VTEIVLGAGTSHSPLLAIEPRLWAERAQDDLRKDKLFLADGRVLSYSELNAEVDGRYADEAVPEHFVEQAGQAQAALDRLRAAITAAELDVLVVIGDDQGELFSRSHMPAMAVFNGDELATHPKNEVMPNLPDWYREANHGYKMDAVYRHPGAPKIADTVIDELIAEGVDVAVASEVLDPRAAGFGHAYGFVIDRLMPIRPIPILPVLLNTYFPPNVPRPARCYDVGAAIGRAVAAHPGTERVGIIASGGLTHFVVDEELDRRLLGALAAHDAEMLRSVNHLALRSGNSEILNWIMTAGAVSHLRIDQNDYIPVRRTPAGTGIGLGFLTWLPAGPDNRGDD
jgi:hypothetical protein